MEIFTDPNLQVIGWDISTKYRSLIIKTAPPALSAESRAAIEADGFILKTDAHITCIGSRIGQELSDAQFDMMRVAMREFSFDDVSLGDDVYRVAKAKLIDGQPIEREALVVPVGSVAIDRLIQKLSHQLYIALDPYLHVTIATRPDTELASRGIGIASRQEFDEINQGEFFRARP